MKKWSDTYHIYFLSEEESTYYGSYDDIEKVQKIIEEELKKGNSEIKIRIESDTTWKLTNVPKVKINKREKEKK